MMRALLLAGSIFAAAPLAAQDHSGHGAKPAAQPAMDHCAMGHLPPEQCPPAKEPGAKTGGAMPGMENGAHAGMDHGPHAGMDHGSHGGTTDKTAPGAAPEDAVPPRALGGPRHAADAIWGRDAMASARAQLARENGGMTTGMILVERLEARIATDGGDDEYLWDAQAWYGGDLNRFVLKTEGEGTFGGAVEDAEIQALYSRAIGPYFDLQAGARFNPEPDGRTHLVLGVQGLAPYMFHVDAALFLSDRGDLTARVEAEYDQKITQCLILQPRIEAEFSAQDIPAREIGAGVTSIEPGARLRFEIVREFAPYIGLEYEAKLGETAAIARARAGKTPTG